MRKIWLIVILIISLTCKSDEQIKPDQDNSLEPKSSGEIVKHTYYSIGYSEENEQANWVYYELTLELINGIQGRTDDFREDPLVSTGSASLDRFRKL
jgi:DNA/RNA endonuclease G (NUC1)